MSAAAAVALQELGQLRSSGGSLAGEKFNTALKRIARENLRPLGCDLIVRRADGRTRLLIRARANGETCDLITHFFHHENIAGPIERSKKLLD